MAVVQISRIQLRRGRRDNLPQLASGELGWAIDAQELYIGNGAVSEGAPAVGNTKILTEQDDLLGLAGQYAYKRDEIQTGVSIGSPVERTLQAKLDDVVSVRDFGALGDGTDQTEKIQRAVDQLFINSATKGLYGSRVTLRIPAGDYLLSSPIYVPPFANIVGDGIDKTYINANTAANAFRTVNEDSVPGTPAADSTTDASNQARGILLKGMTINHSSWVDATLRLESTRDSIFEDIKFINSWTITDGYAGRSAIGIKFSSGANGINCTHNKFINCEFTGYIFPVYSDFDSEYNEFTTGKIEYCGYGFAFGTFARYSGDESLGTIGNPGQLTGPNHNIIQNYTLIDVYRNGISVENGRYNRSVNNKFIAVGNDSASSSNPVYSVIKFAQEGNVTEGDYFERTADLTVDPLFFPATYIPEVEGPVNYNNIFSVSTAVGNRSTAEDFLQLPLDPQGGTIIVDYEYKADVSPNPILRKGTWTLIYNQMSSTHTFDDVYTFTGNSFYTSALTFTGSIQSGNKYLVQVENSTLGSASDTDQFTFVVKHIKTNEISI